MDRQKRLGYRLLWGVIVCLGGLLAGRPAALQAQTEPTPTPDAEGVITIIVQPNDTLWAIAGRAGISLQELLDFNGISESDFIQPGQKLIVGYGEPPTTPTPDTTPTATATLPPPTPRPPTATPLPTAVCLSAFQDNNGNGLPDVGEALQTAVAFTVYTPDEVVANYVTDGISEPYCLPLEPGSYQITRSFSAGERLTGSGNQAILLNRGDVMYLAFGSQRAGASPAPTQNGPGTDTAVTAPAYPAVIGANTPFEPTPASTGGQSGRSISLIPLGAVIIGGLLLTVTTIYIVRKRTAP